MSRLGRNMLRLVFCGAVWVGAAPSLEALAGEIFRYRDPNGVLHFSNAPTDHRFNRVRPGERLPEDSGNDSGTDLGVTASPPPRNGSSPEARARVNGPSRGDVAKRGRVRAVAVPPPTLVRMIEETAIRYRIEMALLTAIVRAESGYDPQAVSRAGAKGLMQLMPETARSLGVRDVFHPKQNLEGGALYFRRLLHRFGGDATLALAAFNAGPTAVEKYGGIPPFPETRSYVERVGAYRQEYLRSREKLPHMVEKRKIPES